MNNPKVQKKIKKNEKMEPEHKTIYPFIKDAVMLVILPNEIGGVDGDSGKGEVVQSMDVGYDYNLRFITYDTLPSPEDALETYTRLLKCTYLEPMQIASPALKKMGFTACYVDEEGQLNDAITNDFGSELCGTFVVGRVLFTKEKEREE